MPYNNCVWDSDDDAIAPPSKPLQPQPAGAAAARATADCGGGGAAAGGATVAATTGVLRMADNGCPPRTTFTPVQLIAADGYGYVVANGSGQQLRVSHEHLHWTETAAEADRLAPLWQAESDGVARKLFATPAPVPVAFVPVATTPAWVPAVPAPEFPRGVWTSVPAPAPKAAAAPATTLSHRWQFSAATVSGSAAAGASCLDCTLPFSVVMEMAQAHGPGSGQRSIFLEAASAGGVAQSYQCTMTTTLGGGWTQKNGATGVVRTLQRVQCAQYGIPALLASGSTALQPGVHVFRDAAGEIAWTTNPASGSMQSGDRVKVLASLPPKPSRAANVGVTFNPTPAVHQPGHYGFAFGGVGGSGTAVRVPPTAAPPTLVERGKLDARALQQGLLQVSPLRADRTSAQEVSKHFHQTCPASGYTIYSIEQVMSRPQVRMYEATKLAMAERKGSAPREMQLWHGTSVESTEKIVCRGFNRSYAGEANATVYGAGVYFARDSSYSCKLQYATEDAQQFQRVMLCNVLVGDMGQGSRELKEPPVKPGTTELFDSVADHPGNPSVVVIMQDHLALPRFVVTVWKH